MSNAVLGNYSHAKTRNKLVYAVVYLLVNVVRTSRENDYLAVLTPCLSDYLPCLCRNIAVIAVKSLVSAVNRLWYPALYVVPAESLCHDLDNVLPDVEVEVGVQEVLVRETVIVCEQKLGIVGNYRTIEVIVAVTLIIINRARNFGVSSLFLYICRRKIIKHIMKKLFMSVALLLLVVTSFAQTPGYEFTTVVSHQATPVKDQGSTGTCWCFATASFMESELLRMGKGEYDLS